MNAVTTARAGRREWVGLAVLALACLLYSMDLTVLHLAVPSLSADLRPSSAQLLWIIDVYGFLVAGSLLTMGTLGDRIGRRKLLLLGAAAFSVTSVLAAASTSAEMLIASRALMGVAGATLAPSTLALLVSMFRDPRQRSVAIGVWISAFSAGGAVGPLLGGILLEYFWWGSVFLLALPVMALLLALGPRVLPESRDPAAGRLDLPSAALSLAAVLAVIYGLKAIAQDGPGALPALAILAGLAAGALFVRRQLTLVDPMLDLRLFRAPAFSAALATYLLGIFVVFGYFLFIPQYLQLVVGLSPLRAGLVSLPSMGAFIAGAQLAPRLARRVRPGSLMGAGLALAALALAGLALAGGPPSLALLVAVGVATSLGTAPVFTMANELIVGSAPPERAGAASGIAETGAELGGALGIAVLGSVGTAVYRRALADRLPAGVPSEAAETARATLGAAARVADQLPDQLGRALLAVAGDAFVQGLHLAAGISAAAALAAALTAVLLLRHVRAGSEPTGQAEDGGAAQPQPVSGRSAAALPAAGAA
jgi:DHA2 family multidrug resistance protein-like MFS transporter